MAKKKVKISSYDKAAAAVENDFVEDTAATQKDEYSLPAGMEETMASLKNSGLNFKSEVEMQEFLKMSPEDKKIFIEGKEKKRRTIKAGTSELDRKEAMLSTGI